MLSAWLKQKKLLIVDDEPLLLEALAFEAEEIGLQTITASSVAEAIEVLKATPVDFVLSDIRMPVQTGVDLLNHVMAHYPYIHVVLMTGYSEVSKDEILKIGSTGFIHKPFVIDEFTEILNKSAEKTI